jgi:hypothetical protein
MELARTIGHFEALVVGWGPRGHVALVLGDSEPFGRASMTVAVRRVFTDAVEARAMLDALTPETCARLYADAEASEARHNERARAAWRRGEHAPEVEPIPEWATEARAA